MAVSRSASDSRIQTDPQQREAIEHVHGPMLVLAGAGTGKTTVLIRRLVHLIREGHARPDEILALTYTDNAAHEMRERAQRELGRSDTGGLQVATFHAYCWELLKGCQRHFTVVLDKDLWILLRRNLRELRLNYYVRAANTTKFLDDLLEFIRRCQDELAGPEEYSQYVRRIENGELPVPRVAKSKDTDEITDEEALGRCREIAFVFGTVERMLRERNLGTFGHMILRAQQLLGEDAALLEHERDRAKFILVDEFQDANFAQIKILEQLAARNQNIFAVGDPDQGIYRFRGASSGAFELFQRYFPDSKLVVLAKSRRSTTSVLRCAHALISENPGFELKAGEGKYSRSPLISARDEDEKQKASKKIPVEAVLVSGNFMEATDLVSTLIDRRRRSRCNWTDIGILYRSHHHRDEVAAELARNAIPFSIEGLDVMDAPEVRDLVACLGAVVSADDSAAVFRVAALAQFPVDPNELRSAMKALPRDIKGALLSALPQITGGPLVLQTVQRAREEIKGSKTYSALLTLIRHFKIRRNAAIEALLQFANQWEKSPITETGEPGEFLEYLNLFREARGTIPLPASEDEAAVKLMSVHSAKGLEFDHVFILRAVKGSFPVHYREPLIEVPAELRNSGLIADQDEKTICEQEERRLFYVAMTRARDTLTMYGQFGRGQTDKTPPGYLRELIKHRELKPWLKHRTCREFQTDIFATAQPQSRLAEWTELPPATELASTLSASAIQRYELCPLQFKLEREWRIPADPSAALQYGACVHRVLWAYYDSVRFGRPMSDEAVLEFFRADLADAGFSDHYQRELYERKGVAELREFLSSAKQSQAEVLHTEEQFSVKIGSTTLVGRIDRVDRLPNGCVTIIDYKTGKPRSQEDTDDSLQLSLYALAAREKWGYSAERLFFHNLEGNTAVGTKRSNLQLQAVKLHVEDIATKIASGDFAPQPGFHCSWCAYRMLCPKTEKRIPEILVVAASEP